MNEETLQEFRNTSRQVARIVIYYTALRSRDFQFYGFSLSLSLSDALQYTIILTLIVLLSYYIHRRVFIDRFKR